MRRKLFTFLCALSLLLCVAACVLCVRSYWRVEVIGWIGRHPTGAVERPGRWVGVMWGQGSICVFVERPGVGWRAGRGPFTAWSRRSTRPDFLPSSSVLGLGTSRLQQRAADGSVTAGIHYSYAPLWLVAAAAAVLPAFRVRRRIRERSRLRSCRCPSCGYDLRATPGRCPECGTSPAVKS